LESECGGVSTFRKAQKYSLPTHSHAGYCIDLSPANEAERQMIERQAKIVGGQMIDATAEPIAGVGPGGLERKPD
jgi:hypothetical protein